ncbi:MAG: hypothetical protein H7A05_11445 [Pseudomonadales bacterium]|nr:hypothetical protein [Pseudomonadales bacterium]
MYTHFRTEFVRQSKAAIMRRVTMTQFMFVIIALAVGLGLFNAPWWTAPFFIIAGYIAGYDLRGEMVLKRLWAYARVQTRLTFRQPRLVNIEAEWEKLRIKE